MFVRRRVETTTDHLTKNDSIDKSDDVWFKEMWKHKQEEWNKNVMEGIKPEAQHKYLKEIK